MNVEPGSEPIIDGRQKPKKRWMETFITLAGWVFLLGMVMQFLGTIVLWYLNIRLDLLYIFNPLGISLTIRVFYFTILWATGNVLAMTLWRAYNKRRFGSLRRRRFPPDVDLEDLASWSGVSSAQIRELQAVEWVELSERLVAGGV